MLDALHLQISKFLLPSSRPDHHVRQKMHDSLHELIFIFSFQFARNYK